MPDDAAAMNSLAWSLATASEDMRRPERAVELARRAVELKPNSGRLHNTLGQACYRAGDWNASIAALDNSMDLRRGGDSFDWFFLAMAHWQLGHADEAGQWYDRAVEWMETNQPQNDELLRIRTEAAALLKVQARQEASISEHSASPIPNGDEL
jgi:tetratricopeptide (TPR) repeat protein